MKTKHIAFAVAVFASVALVGLFLYLKSIDKTPENKELTQRQQPRTADPLQELFQEEIDEAQKPKTEDPLKKLLGILEENSPSEMLKADFLTPELKKFNLQKSASLQSCIQSTSTENSIKGKIVAFYNPNGDISSWQNADGTINKIKLRGELAPVFGEAVNASALNWRYDEQYFKYTFLMPEGDESLWYCYFTQEPFFLALFRQVSFEIDPSKTTNPTVNPTPTILSTPTPSTPTVTPTPVAIVTPTPLIPIPTTPPSPTNPLPCDRTAGGAGCFGQSWDGRWWTKEEEMQDKVIDYIPNKNPYTKNKTPELRCNLALYVPSKAAFIDPKSSSEKVMVIFGGHKSTYISCAFGETGYGPDEKTATINKDGTWAYNTRNFSPYIWTLGGSTININRITTRIPELPSGEYMKSNVTYLQRNFLGEVREAGIPKEGTLKNKSISEAPTKYLNVVVLLAAMGRAGADAYGTYIYAVSKDPTPIVYDEKDPCMFVPTTYKGGNISSEKCSELDAKEYAKNNNVIIYVKSQVAPSTENGRELVECHEELSCNNKDASICDRIEICSYKFDVHRTSDYCDDKKSQCLGRGFLDHSTYTKTLVFTY